MNIIRIVGIVLSCIFIVAVLRKVSSEMSFLTAFAVGVIVFLFILDGVSVVLRFADGLISPFTEINENYTLLLKCIGIGYVTSFACQTCDDAGESGLSKKMGLAGRVCIIVTGLPLITSFLETVKGMLN